MLQGRGSAMVLLMVKKSNADVYELLNKLNRKYGLEYFQCFGTSSDAAWDFEITQDEYRTLREVAEGSAFLEKFGIDYGQRFFLGYSE